MNTLRINKSQGFVSNTFNIRSLAGFILFASIPFSFIRVHGVVPSLAGHVMIFEAILYLSFLVLLFDIARGRVKIEISSFDLIVFGYVFVNLISVIMAHENLYVAMREFRHSMFVPLLLYLAYKLLFDNVPQILGSFLFLNIGLLFQLGLVFIIWGLQGIRPSQKEVPYLIPVVPLSMLFAFAIAYFWSYKNIFSNLLSKTASTIGIPLYLGGLIATMSRGPLLGLVAAFFLSVTVFRRKWIQPFFLAGLCGLLILFFITLSVIPMKYLKYDPPYYYKKESQRLERLISLKSYTNEIKRRLSFWRDLYQIGLKKPILGHGIGVYESLNIEKTAHPHNIYIHTFINSGFVGLLLFISLVIMNYIKLFKVSLSPTVSISIYETTKLCFGLFCILLIVGFTNDFITIGYLMFFILLAMSSKLQELALKA